MVKARTDQIKLISAQDSARKELVGLVSDVTNGSRRPAPQLEIRSCRRIQRKKKPTNRITWLMKMLFNRENDA